MNTSSSENLSPERLPREDLLLFRQPDGTVAPVKTAEDWQLRRDEIVRSMESIMGPFPDVDSPKRVDFDLQVEEEIDRDTYVIRRITYQTEPGCRTPAFLSIPKAALTKTDQSFPAALCLHPTDMKTGAGVVVGLGGKKNRQYASELAGRGFVTIAPVYPHLSNYEPDLAGLDYDSGTMKAIWDNVRALDLLETLPFVKPGRYAAIGHSLGGHNAIFTAIFEPRIVTIVSSCGFDSFVDYDPGNPDVWHHGEGWCQERYMPLLADYTGRLEKIPFDFHELIAALAPRKVYICAPLNDDNFKWESVDRIAEAARPVFKLFGPADALRIEHPDTDHDFAGKQRESAYRLITAVLK